MPVKSEKEFVHVRIRISLARGLRKIALKSHRYGIQVDANLAIEEYIQKHQALTNPKDNGR